LTQHPSAYTYDPKLLRYRDNISGRFVSSKTVRASVDQLADAESQSLKSLAQDMMDGKINFAEWQIRSLDTIKRLNVAMGLAANGGIAATDASSLGYIGSLVKKQYQYFRGLVNDIRKGTQALDGTLLARMGLYGQAGRSTYHDMLQRNAKEIGLTESKRTLGVADHCRSCLDEAARGWVPIGQSLPIGDGDCLVNCHCDMIFR
jgi:hypothetical protein